MRRGVDIEGMQPRAMPRPTVARTRDGRSVAFYKPPKGMKEHPALPWKRWIRGRWRETGYPKAKGPLRLELVFRMRQPKRPEKRAYAWHDKKPDLDNLEKAVKDALNGVAWYDDSQIAHVDAKKVWASGPGDEGVTITIEPLHKDGST